MIRVNVLVTYPYGHQMIYCQIYISGTEVYVLKFKSIVKHLDF